MMARIVKIDTSEYIIWYISEEKKYYVLSVGKSQECKKTNLPIWGVTPLNYFLRFRTASPYLPLVIAWTSADGWTGCLYMMTIKAMLQPNIWRGVKGPSHTLLPGWTRNVKMRKMGATAGRWDTYITEPQDTSLDQKDSGKVITPPQVTNPPISPRHDDLSKKMTRVSHGLPLWNSSLLYRSCDFDSLIDWDIRIAPPSSPDTNCHH